jgi:hypothetical protein
LYLAIEAGNGTVQVVLREAADTRSLRVAADVSAEDAGRILGACGLGVVIGDVAWLTISALQRLTLVAVATDHDESAAYGFNAMIAYAGDHDWLNPGQTHVQAHVTST